MPNCHEKQERRVDIYRIIIVQFKIAVNEGPHFYLFRMRWCSKLNLNFLELTLPKIGFKVLQGPHVGEVYITQISRGLSWYNLRSAYCKISKLGISYQINIFIIWANLCIYLSLMLCARNVKAHFNIFVGKVLLCFFSDRLQFN